MSFEERGAWSGMVSGVLAFFIWGRPIWTGTVTGAFDGPDGLARWAIQVIWLIGGGVLLAIAVLVLFNIGYAILTRQPKPQFIIDERDTRISHRGALVSLIVVNCAILIAIILLALGLSALAALNTILVGMAVAAVASEMLRIVVYRLGT